MLILKFAYPELPFLEQMALGFAVTALVIIVVSGVETNLSKSGGQETTAKGPRFGLSAALTMITLPMGIIGMIDHPFGSGGWIFALVVVLLVLGIFGLVWSKNAGSSTQAFSVDGSLFKTDRVFNICAVIVLFLLTLIYTALW
jgi:hypothetical protein